MIFFDVECNGLIAKTYTKGFCWQESSIIGIFCYIALIHQEKQRNYNISNQNLEEFDFSLFLGYKVLKTYMYGILVERKFNFAEFYFIFELKWS